MMLFKNWTAKKDNPPAPAAGPKRASRIGPSIITGEVVIEGNLITGGELQVDGTINGDVRAMSVVIDAQGIVHGEVAAEEVICRGRIIGPIRGIHVHIMGGSHVEGDILSETISIENGAHVDGNIRRSDDPLSDEGSAGGYAGERPSFPKDPPAIGIYENDTFRPVSVDPPRKSDAAE